MQARPSVQSRLLEHLRMISKIGSPEDKTEAAFWREVLLEQQEPEMAASFATGRDDTPEVGK